MSEIHCPFWRVVKRSAPAVGALAVIVPDARVSVGMAADTPLVPYTVKVDCAMPSRTQSNSRYDNSKLKPPCAEALTRMVSVT